MSARAALRAALAALAEKAKTALPALNGRVEGAVSLVLAGDVELHSDGTATVGSSSDASKAYPVAASCRCPDIGRAPKGLCRHKLAAVMALRLQEQGHSPVQAQDAPVVPEAAPTAAVRTLPEAPASINVRLVIDGREVQLTLRDTDEARLAERLTALLAHYPVAQAPPSQPPSTQPTPEGWCSKHGLQMKLNHGKDGRQWFSHKTAEGWCKGK